jgi:hypothetical protein
MLGPDLNQPFDEARISLQRRRREILARLAARIRAEGGTTREQAVAILAVSNRLVLGDLWRDLCGGAR